MQDPTYYYSFWQFWALYPVPYYFRWVRWKGGGHPTYACRRIEVNYLFSKTHCMGDQPFCQRVQPLYVAPSAAGIVGKRR